MIFLKKFQSGLKKTSNYLSANILNTLSLKKIDGDIIEDLESILLSSDVGIEVTNQLIKKIRSIKISDPKSSEEIFKIIAYEIEIILKSREKKLIELIDVKPEVFLFIGVNGSGKTTTIGKIINKISPEKKILVGACDTFRAAAAEQLKEWLPNKNTDFYQGNIEEDPASVAYTASIKAKNELYDYLIIDTAGRLSNNTNLLNQLVKIKKAIMKTIERKNIKTILILDGTNGSNMIKQVEIFNQSLDVDGLIITKIDGTAKGGALVSIAKKYEIPLPFVGLGESVEDLLEFTAKEFSHSMLGLER